MKTLQSTDTIAGVMEYADGTYAPAIFTRDYADNWYCWVANKTPGGTTQRAALMAARKTIKVNERLGIKALNDHWTSYTNGPSMMDWFKDNGCFTEDNLPMVIPKVSTIKTAAQAEDLAQRWQQWFGEADHYMSELADWGAFFTELADKFDLTETFKENGII